MTRSTFLLVVAALVATVSAIPAEPNTLVLLDNLAIKETHSIFFRVLQGTSCIAQNA